MKLSKREKLIDVVEDFIFGTMEIMHYTLGAVIAAGFWFALVFGVYWTWRHFS